MTGSSFLGSSLMLKSPPKNVPPLAGHLKKHSSTKANTKRKILPQPIIFSTDKSLNYSKCYGETPKME